MRANNFLLLFALLSMGCGSQSESVDPQMPVGSTSASTAEKVDPDSLVFRQLHEGTTQLDGAADTIEEALRVADSLRSSVRGAVKNALEDILEYINSAGETIADFTIPPPSREDFDAHFAQFDDRRLKAIDAGNDARHEIREALGIADALGQDQSIPKHKEFDQLADLLSVAASDLADAVIALGGKVEEAE